MGYEQPGNTDSDKDFLKILDVFKGIEARSDKDSVWLPLIYAGNEDKINSAIELIREKFKQEGDALSFSIESNSEKGAGFFDLKVGTVGGNDEVIATVKSILAKK